MSQFSWFFWPRASCTTRSYGRGELPHAAWPVLQFVQISGLNIFSIRKTKPMMMRKPKTMWGTKFRRLDSDIQHIKKKIALHISIWSMFFNVLYYDKFWMKFLVFLKEINDTISLVHVTFVSGLCKVLLASTAAKQRPSILDLWEGMSSPAET